MKKLKDLMSEEDPFAPELMKKSKDLLYEEVIGRNVAQGGEAYPEGEAPPGS